ncbi:MAG: GAK system XXXCH domain-containing protein [Thermodesulfobacteriota bacterium]
MKKKNSQEFVLVGSDAILFMERIIAGMSKDAQPSQRQTLDFDRIKKLKLTIRKQMSVPQIKCKIKWLSETPNDLQEEATSSFQHDRPEYSLLKKRLNKLYRLIEKYLEQGVLPSNVEMELFCRHAEEMTTYSGYGDERYPVFLDKIHALREAYLRVNIQEFRKVFSDIAVLKKNCHRDV